MGRQPHRKRRRDDSLQVVGVLLGLFGLAFLFLRPDGPVIIWGCVFLGTAVVCFVLSPRLSAWSERQPEYQTSPTQRKRCALIGLGTALFVGLPLGVLCSWDWGGFIVLAGTALCLNSLYHWHKASRKEAKDEGSDA